MWGGFWILGAFLWILISFWPAMVASRKGHSFFGWWLMSLFFWGITLFIAYFGLDDKTRSHSSHEHETA